MGGNEEGRGAEGRPGGGKWEGEDDNKAERFVSMCHHWVGLGTH